MSGKILAFFGVLGLALILCGLWGYLYPGVSFTVMVGCVIAAYFFSVMLFLSVQTTIERLVAIILWGMLLGVLFFALRGKVSEGVCLLVLGLIGAVIYSPVFMISIAFCFQADLGDDESVGIDDQETRAARKSTEERERLIAKTLRRRERKLTRRFGQK